MRSHLIRIAILFILFCVCANSIAAQISNPLPRGNSSVNGELSVNTNPQQGQASRVKHHRCWLRRDVRLLVPLANNNLVCRQNRQLELALWETARLRRKKCPGT